MHGDTVATAPHHGADRLVPQRLADADQLRWILLRSGNLDPDRADRDAAMWNAVLATLQAFADWDEKAQ